MKAPVLTGIKQFEIRQVLKPKIVNDTDVLRKVNMDSIVTHNFPLEDTQKTFDLVANYRVGVFKAMITIA
jgi:hypothetical protein